METKNSEKVKEKNTEKSKNWILLLQVFLLLLFLVIAISLLALQAEVFYKVLEIIARPTTNNDTLKVISMVGEVIDEEKEISNQVQDVQDGIHDLKKYARACKTEGCVKIGSQFRDLMNMSINPCDDMYTFVCQNWNVQHPIPSSDYSTSGFSVTRNDVLKKIKDFLSQYSESSSRSKLFRKVRLGYMACTDTLNDNRGQLEYMQKFLKWLLFMQQSSWPSLTTQRYFFLESALSKMQLYNIPALLHVAVEPNLYNTKKHALYIDEGVLGMPREYFLSSHFSKIQEAYKKIIFESMRLFMKYKNSSSNIEALVSELTLPREEKRTTESLMKLTSAEFIEMFSSNQFNPVLFLHYLFKDNWFGIENVIAVDTFIVRRSLVKIFEFLKTTNMEHRVWGNYFGWIVMRTQMKHINEESRRILFEFTKILTGQREMDERWKMCISSYSDLMGMVIGAEYVRHHFSMEILSKVDLIVNKIKESAKHMIQRNSWMSPESKLKSLEKLDAMQMKIAFPEHLFTDGGDINDYFLSDYYGQAVATWKVYTTPHLYNILLLNRILRYGEMDRLYWEPKPRWYASPHDVNAFYNPFDNSVTLPAGILQPPFYYHGAPLFLNFGSLGSIIGHEISHGFDDQGRKFDKDGNLKPWWDSETIKTFQEKAQCFLDQYDKFVLPNSTYRLNARNTIGENIADNVGVEMSFISFQQYEKDRGNFKEYLPTMEDYSSEAMFFVSFAAFALVSRRETQNYNGCICAELRHGRIEFLKIENSNGWCTAKLKEALQDQSIRDVHSPAMYRVLGVVANSQFFKRAFNCTANAADNRTCKLY